jgi:glycosyltransferase involved in cell wall biosynthesis
MDKCLETVVAQTIRNLDIIIVDDASTDNTPNVVAAWQARDKRIRSLRLPIGTNGGAGQPTNRGIELCSRKSKYLALVDGDDFIAPTMYEKMVAKAEEKNPPLDYVLANFAIIDENLGLVPAYDMHSWGNLTGGEGEPAFLKPHKYPKLFSISPVPWRKLYNMDFIQRHRLRFPEGDYFFEDNSFHWVTTLNAQHIGVVDEVFCFHRRGRAGQTTAVMLGKSPKGEIMEEETEDMDAEEPDEEDDGGSRKSAAVAGLFGNINHIGMYLFHVFSKRDRTKKFNWQNFKPRDKQRDFAKGEFEVLAAEYIRWITNQNHAILDKVVSQFFQLLSTCTCLMRRLTGNVRADHR